MFTFAGHASYLRDAGLSLGLPAAIVDRARRQPAVGECANQLSQAMHAPVQARPEILRHALERVQALAVAHAASVAMFDEVAGELGLTPEPDAPEPDKAPTGRRTRKANP